MIETDSTLFTTPPNKTTTAHTIMMKQKKSPPPPPPPQQNGRNKSHKKTFQEMYINVNRAKQERDDIRFTHIAIPTSFYRSPPRGPTQYPHANYLSIHHPCNPQNFITVSITQQLHHMHKHNNSKSMFSHMAASSQNNNQKITKTPASAKQPTATSEPDSSPPHTSRPPLASNTHR